MSLNISGFQIYCLKKTKSIEQSLIHSHSVLFLMRKNVLFKDRCFHNTPVNAFNASIISFELLSGT